MVLGIALLRSDAAVFLRFFCLLAGLSEHPHDGEIDLSVTFGMVVLLKIL